MNWKQTTVDEAGDVNFKEKGSPWKHYDSFHLYLGSVSYHLSHLHLRVLHVPHAHVDKTESKKSTFRGYRKAEWAETNFPNFLFPEIPKAQIMNHYCGYNSTEKLKCDVSDSLIHTHGQISTQHLQATVWVGFSSCWATLCWGVPVTSSPFPLSKTGWLHRSLILTELNKQPAAPADMQPSHLQLYLTVWGEPEEFPPTMLGKSFNQLQSFLQASLQLAIFTAKLL